MRGVRFAAAVSVGLLLVGPHHASGFPWPWYRDTIVRSGSWHGLRIGETKRETFARVLHLHERKRILGASGMPDEGEDRGRLRWDMDSTPDDLGRLGLYSRWTLRDAGVSSLCDVSLEGRLITHFDPYLDGWITGHASEWIAPGGGLILRAGMTAPEAIEIIEEMLATGAVTRVEVRPTDIIAPPVLDDTAFDYLEPWDVWSLRPRDWGGLWLTFEQGRLVEIERHVQWFELP